MSPTFPTTRRSVVLSLASADGAERTRAFDTLVTIYWKPLYKYARLAWRRSPQDCEDLTQSFLARLFENETLVGYDPAKASFRAFLRTLFDRHSANEAKAAQRLKRGGDLRRVDFSAAEAELDRTGCGAGSPDDVFQEEWTRSVFTMAVDRVREELTRSGRSSQFALFEAYDLDDDREVSYAGLARRFGLSETTVTNQLAAARRVFRHTVLDVLQEVTASEAEYRAEARALLGVER